MFRIPNYFQMNMTWEEAVTIIKGRGKGNLLEGMEEMNDIWDQYARGNTGDMYIQHGNLIHGSYPNKSKGMRGMYSSTYIVKGEEFESGYNAMRKEIGL